METLPLLTGENLSIELHQKTLKDVLEWDEQFDVVLFLGLLYHFKYPQYIINCLATIPAKHLFISTQCTPKEGFLMVNRLEEMPERMRATMTELTGWHLTRELLKRMLEDAGWSDVVEGSDTSSTFFNTKRSITNSTYLYANRDTYISRSQSMNYEELLKYYPR